MKLEILSAKVVRAVSGTDTIFLTVEGLPNPAYPFLKPLAVKITASADTGADWVRTHLFMEPEVI